MTTTAAERDTFSGAVRPFEARVVRQEWAAQAVTPMVDALGERRPPSRVPATAYGESPRAFYVYRMRRGSDDHVGVVADVRLDAFAGGGIRGHESVEPQRVDALVRYYADLPTHSEPVALLHGQQPTTASRVEALCRGRPAAPLPRAGRARAHRVAGHRRRGDDRARLDPGPRRPLHRRRPPSRGRAAPRLGTSRTAGRRRGAVHALRDGRAHHVGVPPAGLGPGRRRLAAGGRGRPLPDAAGARGRPDERDRPVRRAAAGTT